MKKSFQSYYRPSEETFRELWGKCIFIPDTNMLLNIYCYSESTTNELIGILEKISPQLWIPYQVGLEYHRHRPEVILQQEKAYDDIKKILEEMASNIEKKLNLSQSHPSINKTEILKLIKKSFTSIHRGLNKQKSQHPNLLEIDPLRAKLTDLFDGKVGEAFPSNKLDELYKMGEERYKKRIPPGYMDEKKEGNGKYGDVVIWFQMIEKAKESKMPIIFITDDDKEDWWLWAKEKRIGPRPELIEEMLNNTSQAFYMYGVERFMEYARTFLKHRVDQKAIKEVRDVRKQSEKRFAEILFDIKMDAAKSLAIKKEALDNIFVSSTSQRVADMLASSTSRTIADMCASPASQTIADILASPTSRMIADMCASPASQAIADMLASPTSRMIADMCASPASQAIADMLASPTSRMIADMYTSPASQTIADMLASSTTQRVADSLAPHVLEPVLRGKKSDESTEEKKSDKNKDQTTKE